MRVVGIGILLQDENVRAAPSLEPALQAFAALAHWTAASDLSRS